MDRFRVSRMTLALLLVALCRDVVSDDDVYERLNTRNVEKQLGEKIEEAISDREYFYIGVAGARVTPIQYLCYDQGDTNTRPYASECNRSSKHPVDIRAAKAFRVRLDKVYYANRFDSKSVVCGIEKRLIEEHSEHPFCLTKNLEKTIASMTQKESFTFANTTTKSAG